jgi:hypothetical protein
MVNVSKIACDSLKPYTQNGCRLLIKKTFTVTNCAPKALIPKDCAYIDFVKAETNFGRGNTSIVTYKDKYGNFIKRVFNKKLDNDTETIVKTYTKDDSVLFITSQKSKNKQHLQDIEEAIYPHTVEGKKGITRMKLCMDILPDGSRSERQVYEELSPKTRGKYLETTATRTKDGAVINKTINAGNNSLIEQVKDDPYLYIRNYNRRDFAKSAALYAEEKQGAKGLKGKFIDEELPDSGIYKNKTKNVHIDSSKGDRIDLVNTINHEYRHKFQYNLIAKFQKSLLNIFVKPEERVVFKPGEKAQAVKFWLAGMEYPVFFNKGILYRSNPLEVDARKAGKLAEKEYRFWSDKLSEIFGIPKQMVHNRTLEEAVKDLSEKVSQLRKLYGLD